MRFFFFAISVWVSCFSEPVVVLGGGVGGLTAALYLARAGRETIVIEGREPGGLLTQSHRVQNWPGEREIDGALLMERMRKQAEESGAKVYREELVRVNFSKRPFLLTTRSLDGKSVVRNLKAHSCIIAMGTRPNFLGVVGEGDYWGRGVTNCAVCDGPLYDQRTVGVVGGGDAALLEALYLSEIAKQVYIFVRRDRFRTVERERLKRLQSSPNVKIFYQTEVQEVLGDGSQVTGVRFKKGEKTSLLPLDGLFLAIGSKPNTELFRGALELDAAGYILLTEGQKTSVEGVYAVGDVVDPIYKQAISAAGDGAKAALQLHQER